MNQELDDGIRVNKAWGFGICVSTRGPMHLQGATLCEISGLSPQDAEKIYGTQKAISREIYGVKPKIVVDLERERVLQDSLGICAFASSWLSPPLKNKYGISQYNKLMKATTRIEFTKEKMLQIAERIINVYKMLNARVVIRERKTTHLRECSRQFQMDHIKARG